MTKTCASCGTSFTKRNTAKGETKSAKPDALLEIIRQYREVVQAGQGQPPRFLGV